MTDYTCDFCNYGERIISETANFYVTPTLGQLIGGHLLINTKEHLLGFSNLPEELFNELGELKERLRRKLTELYGPPIFFEHGPASERAKGGCCITHAHIHAVATNLDISDRIRFPERVEIKEISQLTRWRGKEYLFYENPEGKMFVYPVNFVPPQYLRQAVAVKIGKADRWDWREFPEYEAFEETLRELRGKI